MRKWHRTPHDIQLLEYLIKFPFDWRWLACNLISCSVVWNVIAPYVIFGYTLTYLGFFLDLVIAEMVFCRQHFYLFMVIIHVCNSDHYCLLYGEELWLQKKVCCRSCKDQYIIFSTVGQQYKVILCNRKLWSLLFKAMTGIRNSEWQLF